MYIIIDNPHLLKIGVTPEAKAMTGAVSEILAAQRLHFVEMI